MIISFGFNNWINRQIERSVNKEICYIFQANVLAYFAIRYTFRLAQQITKNSFLVLFPYCGCKTINQYPVITGIRASLFSLVRYSFSLFVPTHVLPATVQVLYRNLAAKKMKKNVFRSSPNFLKTFFHTQYIRLLFTNWLVILIQLSIRAKIWYLYTWKDHSLRLSQQKKYSHIILAFVISCFSSQSYITCLHNSKLFVFTFYVYM